MLHILLLLYEKTYVYQSSKCERKTSHKYKRLLLTHCHEKFKRILYTKR